MSRHSQQGFFPIKAHWDTANPVVIGAAEEITRRAFEDTFGGVLKRRIEALVQLPLDGLERAAQWEAIMRIGDAPLTADALGLDTTTRPRVRRAINGAAVRYGID